MFASLPYIPAPYDNDNESNHADESAAKQTGAPPAMPSPTVVQYAIVAIIADYIELEAPIECLALIQVVAWNYRNCPMVHARSLLDRMIVWFDRTLRF